MTVATSSNRVDYTGNGSTTVFSFSFRIFDNADLVVTQATDAGVETELTLGTDYTVTGAGSYNGGSITLASALTSGYSLTIQRVLEITQRTDLRNQGQFFAETHEDVFDRVVMITQQLQEQIDRSARLPVTNLSDSEELVTDIVALADKVTELTAIYNKLAEIETVADDLNEETSEINTVAVNITNVNLVGNSIADINTVADNIVDIQNAEENADAAASSASTANSAAASASTASAAAVSAAGTATTQATNAGNSATAAAGSATSAASSATSASGSASTATTKASEAATSATNAASSATAAAGSATNAASSATTAGTSASTATTQAGAAATSASGAAASASAASTSATNAATSATNAANSATASATSATNSASSATSAANSAAIAAAATAAGLYSLVIDKSANYTVLEADDGALIRVTTTSGAITITLPAISTLSDGFKLAVVKWTDDSNGITVARSSSDTINGATSHSINGQFNSTAFVADFETNQWFAISSGIATTNVNIDPFSGDASTVAFTLSGEPGNEQNTQVFVDGVYQQKSTYSLSGATLTFSTAPPSGSNNVEVVWTQPLAIGVPADNSVTPAKLDRSYAQLGAAQSFTKAQRGTVVALTDGATITPDFDEANNFSVTLGGNRTLANPTNITAGQGGVITFTQDGTGSRTLAYGSYWKFPGGTAPTLTTTAGAVDVLAYQVESATRITARLIGDVK